MNIDNSVNINVRNNWGNAFVRPVHPGWWSPPGARINYWRGWADGVRSGWGFSHLHRGWFAGSWWSHHRVPLGGWHYHFWAHNRPWGYWWSVPVWGSFSNWFTWSAPPTVWAQPVFYDYGPGGNVTIENNIVTIGGAQVATADEFAMTAMDLATVAPPEDEEQASEVEWMALGTFAVSMDQQDKQPNLVVQLAVSRTGIISGTLYDIETEVSQAIQGQVDKETQRVAFRIGESETVVAETGLYNLTQEEAPVLVHFGSERTENYVLVRLDRPEDDAVDEDGP